MAACQYVFGKVNYRQICASQVDKVETNAKKYTSKPNHICYPHTSVHAYKV